MSRFLKIAGISVLFLVALGFVLPVVAHFHQKPAELFVHLESLSWQSVTIQSSNLPSALHFQRGSGEVKVVPIAYGIYRIGIQLATGQMIWSEYYHCDAGVRRRVDVYVTRSLERWHFRQTANQTRVLFDGDVRPEDATEQKPFRLSWI